jgi:hypothetical protein
MNGYYRLVQMGSYLPLPPTPDPLLDCSVMEPEPQKKMLKLLPVPI